MQTTPPPEPSAAPQGEPTGGTGRRLFLWISGLTLLIAGPIAVLVGAVALLERNPAKPIEPLAMMPADPLDEAYRHMHLGETEAAIAVLLSVPRAHRHYARAQRFVGWNIYTRELGRPREGLPYTRRAMLADPTSSNCWEDLGRALLESVQ